MRVAIEGDAAPGSLVVQDASVIEVEADALSIPEHIVVSIEGVAAGTAIHAGDVTLPEGVTLTSDPELLVVAVNEAPQAADDDADNADEAAE